MDGVIACLGRLALDLTENLTAPLSDMAAVALRGLEAVARVEEHGTDGEDLSLKEFLHDDFLKHGSPSP